MKRVIGAALVAALLIGSPAIVCAGESPFGMLDFLVWDHDWSGRHYGSPQDVDRAIKLMKEAGVQWVRMDFLWSDIEPSQGHFRFRKYDRLVTKLSRANIQILGVLGYNASWAGTGAWNHAPDAEAFTLFAAKVAERYKGRVGYWEIWNEPDSTQYWEPQDGMVAYSALLKKVTPEMKRVDPSCKVLHGGLAQAHAIHLKKIYQLAGKDSFDIVNIHPFVDPLNPQALIYFRGHYRGVYKTMEKFGDAAKPIWITEIGCPGSNDPKAGGWWNGKCPTEKEQAEFLRKIYGEALAWPNLDKIFWAFFRDTPNHFHNAVDYFGLVDRKFNPKPAYEAYKTAVKEWEARSGRSLDTAPATSQSS